MVPHYSLIIDLAVKIRTIQVGVVATTVPPRAFICHGTVTTVAVIISIFGGKWMSSVIRKGISSSTLKKTIRQQQHRELYRPRFSFELLASCLIKQFAVQAK